MSLGHCRCDKAGASLAQLVLFIELSLSELNRFLNVSGALVGAPLSFLRYLKADRSDGHSRDLCQYDNRFA